MKIFGKLVDAIHILSATCIPRCDLQRADENLKQFAEAYELAFGVVNMTFNTHLLSHSVACVVKNGPLFAYSGYSMEDNIGHLISLQNGTTDVTTQISQKYLLQKSLYENLENSEKATMFLNQIEHKQFSKTTKVNGHVLVGQSREIRNESHLQFVLSELNKEIDYVKLVEYRGVLLNSNVFYESLDQRRIQKRTNDSFVSNFDGTIFAEIISIILVDDEDLFFLINEKYKPTNNWNNISQHISQLNEVETTLKLVESSYFGQKYAMMKIDGIISCAKFPNMFERN